MNLFDYFILILILYNIIFDGVLQIKAPNSKRSQTTTSRKSRKPLDISIHIISCILYLSLVIIITWSKLFPRAFLIVLVVIPSVIIYLNSILGSSISLFRILINKNEESNLNLEDKLSIDIIAFIILSYRNYLSLNKITNVLSNQQWSKLEIEISLTVCYFLYTFLVALFLIVELITPIKHIRKLCISIFNLTIKAHNSVSKHTSELNNSAFINAHYTKKTLSFGSSLTSFFRLLIYLFLLPISYFIDIIIGFFKSIYILLFLNILLFLIDIIIYIERIILFILKFFTNIPGKKVIKSTFKLSGIFSATRIIIIMRLSTIYQFDESYINIIEFIASAIIIPVIFEWVYSSHQEKNTAKKIPEDTPNRKKATD